MYKRNRPSWIAQTMKEESLNFRKRFGQNFLIDDNALDRIVDSLELEEGSNVLEIGPGLGALTERLVDKDINLIAVEIDRDLASILERDFKEENFQLIVEDVLKLELSQLPEPLIVLGNLPYYITSAIIMLFLESDLEIEHLVFMMQKEVADRLLAEPGSKDYGILSLITQLYGRVEKLFDVGKNCFMPAPKVESTVVRIRPRNEEVNPRTIEIIKAAFSLRRKTLLNSLATSFEKEEIRLALEKSKISPSIRAENLSLEDFLRISSNWPSPL